MCAASERSAPRVLETSDPDDTERAGADLAGELRPGDLVVVRGDLGAGKSTLIRGAGRALGVTGPMPSPTFTLGRLYEGAAAEVAHLDLYRLASLDEEDPGLLDDYLGADRFAFVEWPEHAGRALPATPAFDVRIEHAGGDRRRIVITRGAGA